jgi:hypothetical protein
MVVWCLGLLGLGVGWCLGLDWVWGGGWGVWWDWSNTKLSLIFRKRGASILD